MRTLRPLLMPSKQHDKVFWQEIKGSIPKPRVPHHGFLIITCGMALRVVPCSF